MSGEDGTMWLYRSPDGDILHTSAHPSVSLSKTRHLEDLTECPAGTVVSEE